MNPILRDILISFSSFKPILFCGLQKETIMEVLYVSSFIVIALIIRAELLKVRLS